MRGAVLVTADCDGAKGRHDRVHFMRRLEQRSKVPADEPDRSCRDCRCARLGMRHGLCGDDASLPILDGRSVTTLQEPVVVTRDVYGIPTIAAGSRTDAIRALGYVTAQDRLFQMDLLRRSAGGRLAEIFGEAARDNDFRRRTFGLNSA